MGDIRESVRKTAGRIREIMASPVVSGRIYIIVLAAALLILVLAVRGPEQRGTFITDSEGNAIGIRRNSTETQEEYDAYLRVIEGGRVTEREVSLTVRAVRAKSAGGNSSDDGEDREAEIEAEIDRMISDIEFSEDEIIELPQGLPGGTRLEWSERSTEGAAGYLMIAAGAIALIALVIAGAARKPADEEAAIRREIIRGLPRFCNQLFLMMNAGMILSDAFEMICASYAEYGEEEMSWFERKITELREDNRDHRISTASLINEFAGRYNVKELIRIATILTENERRGSDVIESLSRESGYLWEERKIIARESGRMIDTKMTMPLSLLLIVLIIITMAPALLNM